MSMIKQVSPMRKLYAVGILAVATIFWGSTFSLTKSLITTLDIWIMISVRFFFSALILLAFFGKEVLNDLKKISKKNVVSETFHKKTLMWLIFFSFLNFVAVALQTFGLKEITASNSGFITSLAILFVPFIEGIGLGSKITWMRKLAILLALSGIYIMSYGPTPFSSLTFVQGDFLTLLCSIIYAFYYVLMGFLSKQGLHPATIMSMVFSFTALFSVFCSPLSYSSWIQSSSSIAPEIYLQMIILILIGTVLPYLMMGVGQRILDTTTASLVYILEPVFAMSIAVIFFNEQLFFIRACGASIVVIALFLGVCEYSKFFSRAV